MPQGVCPNACMVVFGRMLLELFQPLFGPDIGAVLTAKQGVLLAVHELLNQNLEFRRFPFEVCCDLPHLSEDLEETPRKMAGQDQLCLVARCAWPDSLALSGCRIPFMAYGEVATTAEILSFRFRSSVEKLASATATARSTLNPMLPGPCIPLRIILHGGPPMRNSDFTSLANEIPHGLT